MIGEFEDEELGRLVVRVNACAKSLVFRTKSDAVYISVPPRTSAKDIKDAIEKLRDKLVASRQKLTRRLIDLDFRIDAEYFNLSLVHGEHQKFLAHSELNKMRIVCPPDTDFNDERLQARLRKVVEEAMRRNAKIMFPSRLSTLSEQHKLPYQSVKINASRGRWGSCSSKKDINLSYFLMMLPGHLIDYVLLHELCHTREMNHSVRFWTLLDEFTDGKANALRQELKNYRTDIL